MGVNPNDMNAYILEHLAHPNDLAHKFLDVTRDEFKGIGLDGLPLIHGHLQKVMVKKAKRKCMRLSQTCWVR